MPYTPEGNMREATPRPWRLQNVMSAKDELVGFTIWEDGASDFPIAGITLPPANLSMMVDEAKANAAFILKACNNHDTLVEALRGVLLTAENWATTCEINGEGPNNPAAVNVRRARLALQLLEANKEGLASG